jgi:hypothetical protein
MNIDDTKRYVLLVKFEKNKPIDWPVSMGEWLPHYVLDVATFDEVKKDDILQIVEADNNEIIKISDANTGFTFWQALGDSYELNNIWRFNAKPIPTPKEFDFWY